jgi:cytosine/adenosine deaminase-related metal-dependent hydrolase
MLIKNISIPGRKNEFIDIGTRGDIITKNYSDDLELDFNGAIAFPGLINSHDHLEFNLFPKLGNKKYEDYVEWGDDIHANNIEIIEKVKNIPYELRFNWGLYKNLLCGVTTVAHHGNGEIYNYNGMPDIVNRYNYLHSVRLERMWKLKLNLSFNDNPFVIHIGEGTNNKSYYEINELIKWNLTGRKIIGVHGISMDQENCRKFAALVWCPDSNLFLYNKTADIAALKKETEILFGSDSSLSSDWNIWNHLRLARSIGYLDDKELYESLSGTAAAVWRLHDLGSITENKKADIVISKRKSDNDWDNFFNTNPEDILIILKGGRIVFLDKAYEDKYRIIDKTEFDMIEINEVRKYVLKGLKKLMESITTFIPDYEFPIKVF